MNDLHLAEVAEYGNNTHRGNLLGIEPYMTTADYASEEAFRAKLDGYLNVAREKGWLGERTLVVLPEYLGTWLAVAGERPAVHAARSLASAMRALALGHILSFALSLFSADERDKVAASLFRVKADHMARLYQSVFSGLARKYAVTIVAGSIVLPSPHVREGAVVTGRGPLYSVTAVYRPDGLAHPSLVRKAFPITAEQPFITPAPVTDLPIFDTPAGRLGVLICADSWYPAPYECLKAQGVDLLAVPSYVSGHGVWDKPWHGYDGAPAPDDVDPRDVGALTEGQAWRKYALAGRLARSGARYGLNVFLHGALWDLGAESGCAMLVNGQTVIEAKGGRAALLNLWL